MIWFWFAIGTGLVVVGLSLVALTRRSGPGTVEVPMLGRLSRASATACGLALVMGGYHLAAYLGPVGWITWHVRRDLWWLVALGCVAAVVGAVAADRLLDGDRDGSAEGPG